jgi:FkbM family methyltransferase
VTAARVPAPAGPYRRFAYHALVASAPVARSRIGASVWERVWDATVAETAGTTTMRLHGTQAVVNIGHPYPAFMRRWPTYNAPLVELVHQVALRAGRPVTLVDVGASIGDTVLLVRERCGSELGDVWCVEGDDMFGAILEANLGDDPAVHIVHAMASDGADAVPELVRVHAGTASPQGADLVAAAPLDQLLMAAGPVDVVKIDTDGFDGMVLAGATKVLDAHPAVLFEWHPRLAAAAGVSLDLAFDVLGRSGYRRFMWFDKFGRYSHTEPGTAVADRQARADWCLGTGTPEPDWHYDVVALPPETPLDERALQTLRFALRGRY